MPYKDKKKQRKAQRKYYSENKEFILKRSLKWQKDNPERAKAKSLRFNKKYYWKIRRKIIKILGI